MTLQQLIHLRAVLAYGGFGAAGRALGLTQQAVSRSVRMLEDELGRRLIDRGPSGVALTPDGEVVVSLAAELLEVTESIKRLSGEGETAPGRVRVGMSYWYALADQSSAILDVLRRQTDAELQLVPGAARSFTAQIAARELDFALCAEPEDGATLEFTPLVQAGWGVAVANDGSPDALEERAWVTDATEAGEVLVGRLAAAFGLGQPRVSVRSGLPAFALRAIMHDGAAAAVPLSVSAPLLATLGLRAIVPPEPVVVTHGLLKPRRRHPLLDWAALEAALTEVHEGASKG
ncbi:MAG: LysR family transcriptional regulator [Oceanicaulis sp.]